MQRNITRIELCGRAKRVTCAMEKIAEWNAMNRIGYVNYNKYGQKDNVGFSPCSDMFVDNFLLKIPVAEYQIKEGTNEYLYVGSMTKKIYESCAAANLSPISAKAVGLFPITQISPKSHESLLTYVQGRDQATEARLKADGEMIAFKWQEFKVSCANVPFNKVMSYLHSESYKKLGFILKDVDFTIDMSGSFDRMEVVQHMIQTRGFRMAGSDEQQPRTILNNEYKVGRNCLTFMEHVGSYSTRSKFYNKMVQMLECKGVRDNVGQHWKDWAEQKDTNLAQARDASTERGLTRAEVTFYCCDGIPAQTKPTKIPTIEEITGTLTRLISYVPDSLVYSTPYTGTWKVFCEEMTHSLIVVDKDINRALMVYAYNEVTRGISGFFVDDWENNSNWCMSSLTLGQKLPIDVIEISEDKDNCMFSIIGNRYFKTPKPGNESVLATRLVRNGGIYAYSNTKSIIDMQERRMHNEHLVKKSGFFPNENCTPVLAWTKASGTSKPAVDFEHMGAIEIQMEEATDFEKRQSAYEARLRQSIADMLSRQLKREEIYDKLMHLKSAMHEPKERLHKIPLGTYNVMAIRRCAKRFVLLLDVYGQYKPCFPTHDVIREIAVTLDTLASDKLDQLTHDQFDFLCILNEPIAELTLERHSYTQENHVLVHCHIAFSPEVHSGSQENNIVKGLEPFNHKLETPRLDNIDLVPTMNPQDVGHYQLLPNITILPRDSVHVVLAKCHILYRNKNRLVIQLDNGTMYQAGRYMEQNECALTKDCKIKIGKIRTDVSSRNRYAICAIANKDDWATLLTFEQVPMLPMVGREEKVEVKDIATVEHKGKKRDLIRTDENVVY